jgi:hypothetical protein
MRDTRWVRWSWLRVWCVLALATASLIAWPAPARADAPVSAEAKLYFQNGVELLQANPPNYQDAYFQFLRAYEKSKSWKVLGNLGLCAVKLERDGEALQYYAQYLREGGKAILPEERAALERDVLLINSDSAVVNLSFSEAGAELVDARAGTSAPAQTHKFDGDRLALRVRAGSHTLTARVNGKELRWQIVLSPGDSAEHAFDFSSPAPAPALPVPPPLPPVAANASAQQHSSPLRTLGFVAGGVGLAGLATGGVLRLLGQSKENSAKNSCTGHVCPASAEHDFDSAASLERTANVFMIGGAAVTAVALVLVLASPKGHSEGEKSASGLTLVPLLSGSSGGVVAVGAF